MIKEKIYEVLANEPPMKKEQLYKFFNIGPNEKKDFMKLIENLEKEGLVFFNGKKYFVINNEKYKKGIIQGNQKGFGFLLQEEDDIFISQQNMGSALNGDEVVVEVYDESRRGSSKEGKVVSIIKRANEKVVGTFQDRKSFGFVVPDDDKISFDIFISKKNMLNAKEGQKVQVKIDKWPEGDKKPEGKVIQVFGYANEKGVDILSIAASLNLPMEFSKEALQQASSTPKDVRESDLKGREDFRDLTTFTIDGADSKDFDDAVSIEKLENGNVVLGVHIADVSHYVKESDALDVEAFQRGNSVYLIDKVIPMLPKELSNGICSLNEGVDRLTLSVMMELDDNAKVVAHSIYEGVINSSKRLVYDNVSDFLEKGEVHESIVGLEEDLLLMGELAKKLRKKRMDRGSIDFDFPEAKITVDENGRPIDVSKEERRTANKLIEEFMLLCNETVAEQHFWMEIPFLYRIHEEPEVEKLETLNKILRYLGLKLNTQNLDSKEVQKLIESVKGKDEELFVSTLVLRSLKKARYSEINDIHFGLAAKYYSHFTSPIRRYSDLTIHRIIKDILNNKLVAGRIQYLENVLPEIAKQTSMTERIAQDAERKVEDLKTAEYMQSKIGEKFPAVISSITNFGIFAQLDNTIEGLISYQSMDEYFDYNENEIIASSRDSNKTYHVGDKIVIEVVSTNVTRGNIDFKIVGEEDGEE